MWRGVQLILQGRDPRDAWTFTQRVCGVCPTVHALVSVRAVENALDLEVPVNAQYIRNIAMAAQGVNDHIVDFYHLTGFDWIDMVTALGADPAATARLGMSLSDYPHNSVAEIRRVQEQLSAFAGSGHLSEFTSGRSGHPAMQLPPEVELLVAAHYLQALEYQRAANRIAAIFGSETPRMPNLAVGGVTNSTNAESQFGLNLDRLHAIKADIDTLGEFVHEALVPDVGAVAGLYAETAQYGAGITNYLSVPDMPLDSMGTQFELPGGHIDSGDVIDFTPITSHRDAYFRDGVKESVKHARHEYQSDNQFLQGCEKQGPASYNDFGDDTHYSWAKAPTFYDKRAQVGPLANVLCMYAAGHEPTKRHLNRLLSIASTISGKVIPLTALHSTLGRVAARAVRAAVLYESLHNQWQLLMDNIANGDFDTFNRPVFPKGEVFGSGYHEAPLGTLSHWAVIERGKIANYQAVVPTTWNAGPRDNSSQMGPFEAALLNNPVADVELPLEVLRTVHSFDPCLACTTDMIGTKYLPIVRIKAA